MTDYDPDDIFRGPNDDAYEKTETRRGPPLDYVAEKLRNALKAMHSVIVLLRSPGLTDSERGQAPETMAVYAFRSQLVGYLALKNMLALVNNEDFFDRLEGHSREEFDEWLVRIDEQGSVTG